MHKKAPYPRDINIYLQLLSIRIGPKQLGIMLPNKTQVSQKNEV